YVAEYLSGRHQRGQLRTRGPVVVSTRLRPPGSPPRPDEASASGSPGQSKNLNPAAAVVAAWDVPDREPLRFPLLDAVDFRPARLRPARIVGRDHHGDPVVGLAGGARQHTLGTPPPVGAPAGEL